MRVYSHQHCSIFVITGSGKKRLLFIHSTGFITINGTWRIACAARASFKDKDNEFVKTFMATDGRSWVFTREGLHNSNRHIWCDETPHPIQEHQFQDQCSINVSVDIVDDSLPRLPNWCTQLDF
jgi:hypothetical protein